MGELGRLIDDLEDLHDDADDQELRADLHETIQYARQIKPHASAGLFGQIIQKYTTRDIGEAFVGSVLFALPMLVEDGVFEIANFFLGFTPWNIPLFLIVNVLFVIGLTVSILYWADFQKFIPVHPLFGFIPRRVIGILTISFLTSAGLMTLWGRVDWNEPVVAMARLSCVWTAASIGASLGDILPGQSAGEDLSETFEEFGERLGDSIGLD